MVTLIFADEFVAKDRIIGPMPNFTSSFDNFFVQKCSELLDLTEKSSNKPQNKIEISLNDNLNWMHQISLANSIQVQNLEIIYNNYKVFFKTTKEIFKGDNLVAFPSKDLEISLGLQYVPFNKDGTYLCKKCSRKFSFQCHLMLHMRYFCLFNTNKMKINDKTAQKRQNTDWENQSRVKRLDISDSNYNGGAIYKKYHKQQTNHFFTYLQNLIYSNYLNSNHIMNLDESVKHQISNQFMPNLYLKQVGLNIETYANKMSNFQQNFSKINETEPRTSKASEKLNIPNTSNEEPMTIQEKGAKIDSSNLTQLLSTQSIQNWCAKCNSHFRLTSDLVYHMRTFHRKDEQERTSTPSVLTHQNRHEISKDFTVQERSYKLDKLAKAIKNNRETKFFKCEICQESFKEKHHLSRHMTSHR